MYLIKFTEGFKVSFRFGLSSISPVLLFFYIKVFAGFDNVETKFCPSMDTVTTCYYRFQREWLRSLTV